MKMLGAMIGCLASFIFWAIVGLFMMGHMMGDCSLSYADDCPSDAERWAGVRNAFLVGLAIYAAMVGAVWMAARPIRRHPEDEPPSE